MAHTLKNVAEAAGVSPATASIVLNGRAKGRVSEEVANRVIATAKELNYHPNLTARSLRTQESKTIGLISDQIATTPFASQMLAGAQMEAVKEHWLLFVVNADGDKDVEFSASRALIQNNVSGFIYASMYHREVEVPNVINSKNVVLLDCYDKTNRFHTVIPNEYGGARNAVQFLVKNGHKKIAHITDGKNTVAAPAREKAFRDVLRENKIEFVDEYLIKTPSSNAAEGYEATKQLLNLKNRPTSIFAYTDRMAMGAYAAAHEAGLEIGKDISIIGFDNQPDIANALRPGLTTIQLPHYEMGKVATHLLINELKNSESESAKEHQIDCPLVVRDSVGSAR